MRVCVEWLYGVYGVVVDVLDNVGGKHFMRDRNGPLRRLQSA